MWRYTFAHSAKLAVRTWSRAKSCNRGDACLKCDTETHVFVMTYNWLTILPYNNSSSYLKSSHWSRAIFLLMHMISGYEINAQNWHVLHTRNLILGELSLLHKLTCISYSFLYLSPIFPILGSNLTYKNATHYLHAGLELQNGVVSWGLSLQSREANSTSNEPKNEKLRATEGKNHSSLHPRCRI